MQHIQKKRLSIFAGLLALSVAGVVLYIYLVLPDSITLLEGSPCELPDESPLIVSMQAGRSGMLEEDGTLAQDTLSGYNMEVKLFGIIPMRNIEVNVAPQREVVPCGSAIGIKIITDGMLVVGTAEIRCADGRMAFPAKDYDIREGDIITKVNGVTLTSTEQFTELVRGAGDAPMSLELKRNEKSLTREVRSVQAEDGTHKLGVWVRDSTAGIGTLTFVDEASKEYGALGHPVTDGDTGSILQVSQGEILEASIFAVQKGEKGAPGELKGIFQSMEDRLGTITKNTEQGIYGTVEQQAYPAEADAVPVASRSDIHEGKATILSNISNEEVRSYEIEIQKVMRYNNDNNKDMVIRVTDPALLQQTGGIVQGMSGSPILQDGKLIGAVTHVFVNDPTRGYGIFIENMLKNVA